MNENNNIGIVRSFVENVLNAHNPPALGDYVSDEFAAHFAGQGTIQGLDNYTKLVTEFFLALPDAHWTEMDAVAQGNKVCIRFVIQATHEGELWGIPGTGRSVRWEAAMIYSLGGGKIIELRAVEDWTTILRNIGFFSPPFSEESSEGIKIRLTSN